MWSKCAASRRIMSFVCQIMVQTGEYPVFLQTQIAHLILYHLLFYFVRILLSPDSDLLIMRIVLDIIEYHK